MSALRHVLNAPARVASATGIAQDNIIFAMVAFAFVVWITTKGELPTYLGFFKPSGGALGPAPVNIAPASASGASNSGSSTIDSAVNAANSAVNGTGIGSAITSLTGVPPLALSVTGPARSILSGAESAGGAITGVMSKIKGLFGG